ncbi:predicted protein, partial [Nematostella vectensis]
MQLNKQIERNFVKLYPEMSLGTLLKEAVAKSSRNIFPVVDNQQQFLGVVMLDDIRPMMFDQTMYDKVYVSDVMKLAPEIITETDTAEQVMQKFKESVMIEAKEVTSEKAVLIGVITQHQDENQLEEYLDELEFLTLTAGGKAVKRFTQKLEKPHPKTFIGAGKLEDVRSYIETHDIGTAIFDDELSPAQLRNIEKALDCKILDRTNLILDIFAQRAQTSSAKTQVELAQCQYFLPRLTKLWTHLDKQKGGIGMRGPGETEIETDRRIIRDKIALLKKKLATIDKQMAVQRKNRGKM